ncbi:E3 ubiquitin-protein ligase RNF170 [Ischnura elegans]|uniref:E3 ubiquitin-protein ligase RNF170 n=1 Tax=Ischnura elegans TaxID=197161 RepID=UPI001ED8A686|nr:E3 ubiquitin-protein ligase RNF170 [Ischnura elegans]
MFFSIFKMTENLIYGIGDEVLVLTTIIFAIVLAGCLYLRPWILYNRLMERVRNVFQEQQLDPPRSTDVQDQNDSSAQRRAYHADVCPICLGGYTFKVETNCGHTFCGPCMRRYIENDEFVVQTMLCPLCRQPLTLLFNSYTDEERRADPESEVGLQRVQMNILINRFNRIAAGTPRTLLQNVLDWPVLIRRLFNELFSERPMLLFRLRIVLLLLCGTVYVFSPVDALPEAVYGILGFIDDILVVFFCIWYIVNVYRSIVASREGGFE